jgi:meso-butanediol dehydrogenase / (S,S)-butanediol dehydrogenase / diacetyl reductase
MRFKEKVAFVTGAGSGIGRGISLRLSSEGASVIVTDINSDSAKKTKEEIEVKGGTAHDLTLDVTNSKMVEEVVREAWNWKGQIDFLVNDAGVSTVKHMWDLTEQDWDLNMDVNAKGTFLVTTEMAKRMIKHQYVEPPKIVNIASGAGIAPDPLRAHYCASKHAVVGFTKSIALELAPFHIAVNSVCPGLVQTSMQQRELEWESKLKGLTVEEMKEDYLRQVPLGRLETPEDVAALVAFLFSRDGDYVTGQAISVNGGSIVH